MLKIVGLNALEVLQVGRNLRNAGLTIQMFGKAEGQAVDNDGCLCALEAIARTVGTDVIYKVFTGSCHQEVTYQTEEDYQAFQVSPEVQVFAEYLRLTGRANKGFDSDDTEVIWNFSDSNTEEDVIDALFGCAAALGVE